MTRSLKNLYPEKYAALKSSDHYAFVNANQTEINTATQLCKELAHNICAICGDRGIDAHHITPLKSGGSNDQENLICLCRKCHQQTHKGVYIINADTKEITPGIFPEHCISDTDKPYYIREFEKLRGFTLYKQPTGKYYTFIDGVKTFFTVADIKADVGYCAKTYKMSPEKRRSINDRKVLQYWKNHYKEKNDKVMWHIMCNVIKNWDLYDDNTKESVFATLHGNLGNFSHLEKLAFENQL